MLNAGYDGLSHLSQQNKTSGRNDEKMVARHNQTLFLVVRNALVNVLVDEVLILH